MMAGGDFCAYCNHFISWHDQWDSVAGAKTEKCTPHTGNRCDCTKFCSGFVPSDDNGLMCFECGRNYFNHEMVKRTIVARFGKTEDLDKALSTETTYRLFPDGLQLCCEWTMWHFMKRIGYVDLKKGQSIKCVNCSGVMTLKDFDNEGVPEWVWKFFSPSTTPTLPTVGPAKQLPAAQLTNIRAEAMD